MADYKCIECLMQYTNNRAVQHYIGIGEYQINGTVYCYGHAIKAYEQQAPRYGHIIQENA